MIPDIQPASHEQFELDLVEIASGRARSRLMKTMDRVNGRWGKGTVKVGRGSFLGGTAQLGHEARPQDAGQHHGMGRHAHCECLIFQGVRHHRDGVIYAHDESSLGCPLRVVFGSKITRVFTAFQPPFRGSFPPKNGPFSSADRGVFATKNRAKPAAKCRHLPTWQTGSRGGLSV